jgi:hypothetical protein
VVDHELGFEHLPKRRQPQPSIPRAVVQQHNEQLPNANPPTHHPTPQQHPIPEPRPAVQLDPRHPATLPLIILHVHRPPLRPLPLPQQQHDGHRPLPQLVRPVQRHPRHGAAVYGASRAEDVYHAGDVSGDGP